MPSWKLTPRGDGIWQASFTAMASPCEVLVECERQADAARVARLVAGEAKRIETLWSRYIRGNVIHRINNAEGAAVKVDDETGEMLDFAATLYELSGGSFDITSGVLRRVWRFDRSDNVPSPEQVSDVQTLVGWDKANWQRPHLTLPSGMEVDFGGIGKEYAVDSALAIANAALEAPMLVNFGGDLAANRPQLNQQPWLVGVDERGQKIALFSGGIATSGDAERYLLRDGVRYSHCLDANNGWPVAGSPSAVTVLAPSCVEAGMAASLTMLQGAEAKAYLDSSGYQGYIQN